MVSLMAGLQVLAVQAAGFETSAAVTAPPAPAEALIATVVAANVAVSVSGRTALNEQGLATPLQVPPLQLASWKPELPVASIVMASVTFALQLG
jgi:hypothetical protein